jgi:hypothetical protein
MAENDDEQARILFKILPMSAKRVKTGKPMKPYEAKLLKKVFPDVFKLCTELTAEQVTEINKKYIDSMVHGDNIKIMITPQGQAWLKETLAQLRSYKEHGE